MKILKYASIVLILMVMVTIFLGCSFGSNKANSATQPTAAVTRGNLTSEITAAGNLALSQTEDLAFETAGTVQEVSVSEGDSVKAGQVLATLDTSEWDKQLKTLRKAVSTAQRNLSTKQAAETKAKRDLANLQRQVSAKQDAVTKAQRQVTAKQVAVTQAQLDLHTAQDNLGNIGDVKTAQDAVDNAQYALDFAQSMLNGQFGGGVGGDLSYWSTMKVNAKDQLTQAQNDLKDILSDTSITTSSDVALQVSKYQLAVTKSQMALEDARIAVNDANSAVDDAQQAVDDANYAVQVGQTTVQNAKQDIADAQSTLDDAQSALDDAEKISPIIAAPFDGFITKVNVAGGDDVLKGAVAAQIANPNKFEAEILVSEVDIMKIKLGGEATVKLSAMTGVSLSANVTHISPTATIQSGVVNYKVTVEVQPPSTSTNVSQRAFPSTRNPASGNVTSPFPSTQTPASGNVTSGRTFIPGQRSLTQGAASSLVTANIQLRAGLTATVSIILAQSTNVLLVPNGAVTTQGGQKYVQLVTSTGTPEQRAVQTGLSDYQYTEITSGLSEGDRVIVPQSAAKTTTPTSQQQGAIRIQGMPFTGGR